MAGDWIAVDHELADTPQVLGLIERTGEETATIIGRLVLMWCLADRQTTDGVLRLAGLKSLARQCGGTAEFWQAVVDVGWLTVDGGGVSIPRFKERFTNSARKRMQDAKRMKNKRLNGNDAATETGSSGDDSATDTRRIGDSSATETPSNGVEPATLQPLSLSLPLSQSEQEPIQNPTDRTRTGAGQSPKKPITTTGRGSCRGKRKFSLWKNAKREEFDDPKNVDRVFRLAVEAGICTPDERLHLFRFVASLMATIGPDDNLPGLIVSVLRDNAGKDPWRARGIEHEQAAREWMKKIDGRIDSQNIAEVTQTFQSVPSEVVPTKDTAAVVRSQTERLLAKYGSGNTATAK